LLQIYQSSFFESESQHIANTQQQGQGCCKYIKVPFLKANHNDVETWKHAKKLLQIYQSSFFESESQLVLQQPKGCLRCCKYIKVPFLKANHNFVLFVPVFVVVVANISKFLF